MDRIREATAMVTSMTQGSSPSVGHQPCVEPVFSTTAVVAGTLFVVTIGAVVASSLVSGVLPPAPASLLCAAVAGFSAGMAMGSGAGALKSDLGACEQGGVTRSSWQRFSAMIAIAIKRDDLVVTGIASLLFVLLLAVFMGCCVAGATAVGLIIGVAASICLGGIGTSLVLGLTLPAAAVLGAGAPCLCGAALGSMAAARLWIRWLQDKLLYHPRRYACKWEDTSDEHVWRQPRSFGGHVFAMQKLEYRFSSMLGGDLEQTAFLIRPEEQDPSELWIVFGGNAMVAVDWLVFVGHALSGALTGVAFVLVDYPGYGWNDGRPSPGSVLASSRQAIRAAVSALKSTQTPQVHILGHSIGAAAATQLAAQLTREEAPPGRLVLSAPFLDVPCMADLMLGPLLPPPVRPMFLPLLRALVPHRWDNAALLPYAAEGGWEVGIVHGSLDVTVPAAMGRELHRLASEAGGPVPRFVEVSRAGHNDVLMTALKEYVRLMIPAASAMV